MDNNRDAQGLEALMSSYLPPRAKREAGDIETRLSVRPSVRPSHFPFARDISTLPEAFVPKLLGLIKYGLRTCGIDFQPGQALQNDRPAAILNFHSRAISQVWLQILFRNFLGHFNMVQGRAVSIFSTVDPSKMAARRPS